MGIYLGQSWAVGARAPNRPKTSQMSSVPGGGGSDGKLSEWGKDAVVRLWRVRVYSS